LSGHHRLRAVFRTPDLEAHLSEKPDQQETAFLTVLDHQNPGNRLPGCGCQADHPLLLYPFPEVRPIPFSGAYLKMENTACALPAGDGDVSSHHSRIITADGHAQACTASVSPPGRCLLEVLENFDQFLFGDARTGVLDLHHQTHVFRRFNPCRHPEDNAALVGKFYGIPQEIDQHLAKFILVRLHEAGQVGGKVEIKGQALDLGPHLEHGMKGV